MDTDNEISGDNVCYIYPDLETCLVGKFQQSQMISAKYGVIDRAVEQNVGILTF